MGDKEQREIFSRNLKYYVDRCGHSQKEIAEAIGVSPQTFNTWMRGIALPRMGKVELLVNFFGIKKTDLIDEQVREGERALWELSRQFDPDLIALQEKLGKLTKQNRIPVEILVDALLKKQEGEKGNALDA